jgi:DNA segregation ATPase FtsK/SpoIIIE, S-DNA-T family
MEILGNREAARIPDRTPGRAIIRLGAGHDLRTFQAARIARPLADEESPVRVTRLGTHGFDARPVRRGMRTELDVVVSRISAAAAELALEPATPLWLPPLPLDLPATAVGVADRPINRLVALVGLADLPRQHAQVPHTIDLSASGHQLVSGVFGSGKTTLLCQVASDLAGNYPPEDVHIYGVDAGSGSLGPLASLQHVGDLVGANDVERLTRLLDRLTNAVETRREWLAAAGSGDFLRWRSAGGDAPWIVLLVDDYPAFREVAEHEDMGRLLERFNSLLQNGPPVGVHIVLATTQAVDLRSREINLIPSRLILRSADAADYALVDGRFAPNEAPTLPPGRGLVDRAVVVQVCRPTLDEPGVIEAHAKRISRSPTWANRVERLPTSVDRTMLDAAEGIVLGIGGPEVEPVVISEDGSPTILLVAGPRQSGRSSTLLGLIESVRPHTDHLVVIAPRPSPLRDLAARAGDTIHASATDVDRVLDTFIEESAGGSLLVIDDSEAISSAPGVSARLEQILREASETGVNVIAAARVNDLPGMFDPWARYLMSLRQVVLLQPTVDDAFLFGAKLPRIPPPMAPGRGLLIQRERLTVLQVAMGTTS